MTAPPAPVFAGFCERCDKPYKSSEFPNRGLCDPCYLGAQAANAPRSRTA